MRIATIDWRTNWRAFFGALSEERANAVLDVITSNVPRLTDAELNEAVARLCEYHNRDGDRWAAAPGVRDIIKSIWTLRGRSPDREADERHAAEMESRRERIRRAASDGEAWDIICEPKAMADKESLESYAKQIYPAFERPKFESFSEYVARVWAGLGAT